MDNDKAYNTDVTMLSTISCILSIIGGTVIFVTFVVLPEIRNFTRKLVISLTIADLLTASGIFISAVNIFIEKQLDTDVCQIQSTITTYSSLVSFFFTSIIAIYLFDTVTHKRCRLGTNKWMVVFNILSWGIPGSIVISALAFDVLGSDETRTGGTGPWCWISTSAKNQLMWMLVTGKGWEIACYLITMSLYVLLKIHLILYHRRAKFHQIHFSLRDEDKNFLYVWFLLYVLRVWGTLRFFLYVTMRPSDNEWYMKVLLRLQAFGDPGQAFCNCLLFCLLDKTVFTKLKRIVCCRPQNDSERTKLLKDCPLPTDAEEERQGSVSRPFDAEHDRNSSGYSSMASTRSETLQRDSMTMDKRLDVTC